MYFTGGRRGMIKDFCVAIAKVFSRMAEMLIELLKEKEVKQ